MIRIDLKQAQALIDVFGGDDQAIVVIDQGDDDSHNGPGLYAHFEDYQEEGALYLGQAHDDDTTKETP